MNYEEKFLNKACGAGGDSHCPHSLRFKAPPVQRTEGVFFAVLSFKF